jgi:hypothetical protein
MLGQLDRVADNGPFTFGRAGAGGITEDLLDGIRAFRRLSETVAEGGRSQTLERNIPLARR